MQPPLQRHEKHVEKPVAFIKDFTGPLDRGKTTAVDL